MAKSVIDRMRTLFGALPGAVERSITEAPSYGEGEVIPGREARFPDGAKNRRGFTADTIRPQDSKPTESDFEIGGDGTIREIEVDRPVDPRSSDTKDENEFGQHSGRLKKRALWET